MTLLTSRHVREKLRVEEWKSIGERVRTRPERTRVEVDLTERGVSEQQFLAEKGLRRTSFFTKYSSTRSRAVGKKSALDRFKQNRTIVSSPDPDRSTQGRMVIFRSRLMRSVNSRKSCDRVKAAISAECGKRYSLQARKHSGHQQQG